MAAQRRTNQPWFPRQSLIGRTDSLANVQDRVLTRSQLREIGWRHQQVQHEIEAHRWTAVAPTVVALQNAPLNWRQMLWLGVLHAGPGSAVSHGSAAQLAGLDGWEPIEVHVITAKSNTVERLPGIRFHESRRDFGTWIHPTASPPRLRIEFAGLLAAERDKDVRRGIGLLAACVQQRLTTADRLRISSYRISKLRHGRWIRLSLGDIAGGAHSFAELDLGKLCRTHGLPAPDRQSVRTDKHGRRRYLDCVWTLPDGRILVLEIDGSFHFQAENWWSDMRRERAVVVSGAVVLRCSSIELRLDPWSVLRDLLAMGLPRVLAA